MSNTPGLRLWVFEFRALGLGYCGLRRLLRAASPSYCHSPTTDQQEHRSGDSQRDDRIRASEGEEAGTGRAAGSQSGPTCRPCDHGEARSEGGTGWLMLQQDVADDYVVATGQTHSIRDLLDVAFACVGGDDWTDRVLLDPRFLRPAEVDLLVGDPAKVKAQLGWAPEVGFEELGQMMVEHDLREQRQLQGR